MDKLTPIGLRNIANVTKYKITIRDGNTVHTVSFRNSGKLELTALTNTQMKVTSDKLDAYIGPSEGTLFDIHTD